MYLFYLDRSTSYWQTETYLFISTPRRSMCAAELNVWARVSNRHYFSSGHVVILLLFQRDLFLVQVNLDTDCVLTVYTKPA